MAEKKRTTQLTDMERLVVQNIFDTQPKKRAQYLKELGFDMNPEDENEYRPIGSDQPYGEIDPGLGTAFKKGGLSGIINEAGLDIGDIAVDTGAGALSSGGALAGGIAGTPLGPIAMLLGGFAGGTAGNFIAEEAKGAAANLLLDQDIPMDRRLSGAQSLLVGAFPLVAKGGIGLGKAAWKAALETRTKAIKSAVGAGLTNDMVEVIAKDPESFTVDGVKNANKELLGTINKVFGTEDPLSVKRPDQIKEGIFRAKIQPLNDTANAEITRLGSMSDADLTADELTAPLKAQLYKLSSNEFPKEDAKAAMGYLRDQIKEIERVGVKMQEKRFPSNPNALNNYQAQVQSPNILNAELGAPAQLATPKSSVMSPVGQNRIPFDQAYNLAKKIQEDAFDLEIPGSKTLRQIVGDIAPKQAEKDSALTGVLAEKAAQFGSPLHEINQERSRILKAYKFAASKVNQNNVGTFYTGKDSTAKEAVRQGLQEIDKVIGSDLASEVEKGGVQSFVKDIYERNINGGSKSLRAVQTTEGLAGLVKGGLGGGAIGSAVGAPIPGAIVGGIAGATRGVNEAARFTDPEYALKELIKARSEAAAIDPTSFGVKDAARVVGATSLGAASVGAQNQGVVPTAPAEPEPWPDVDVAPTPVPSQTQSPSAAEPWPEI